MKRDVQLVRAVDATYAEVRAGLATDPVRIVGGTGDPPEMDLVVGIGATEVRRRVLITAGEIYEPEPEMGCHLRFSADASRHSDLFPHLEGRIDVIPISERRTALFFTASYTPPLGALGTAIDLLGLHRFAESSMERLFGDLVSRAVPAGH